VLPLKEFVHVQLIERDSDMTWDVDNINQQEGCY